MRNQATQPVVHLKSTGVAAAVLAAATVLPAHKADAAVAAYSTIVAFDAATTGDTTYSFPIPQGGEYQAVSSPYTVGPLSFSASSLTDTNDGSYGSSTYLAATSSTPTSLSISLAGATALSFDIGTYFGSYPVTVSVNGASEPGFTTSGGAPSDTFYGITSNTPITSVSFNLNTAKVELDTVNFQVGTADGAPEPASLGLLAMGGIGLMRRCQRQTQIRRTIGGR